jgi:glycerophosphoryl diester phosphodiesterase
MPTVTSTPQLRFFAGAKPRIVGHRGAAGDAPENTLPSFRKAFDNGADLVEMDVRGTKDGEVVIIHDPTLDRTTSGRGRVNEQTLRELRAFDAGYRFSPDGGVSFPFRGEKIEIPTLEEFFSSLPLANAIIEIKKSRPPIVMKVVETIRRLGKEGQALLATEDDRIMADIRREIAATAPGIATGFSYGEVASFIQWATSGKKSAFAPSGEALQIPCKYRGITLVRAETVQAAHELGIEVFVWTVNDTGQMADLLALGVDGIITDYPRRLRDLVRAGRP